MGDSTIIITPQVFGLFAGLGGVAVTILSWLGRAFLKRLKESDERTQQRFEKLEARLDKQEARNEERSKKQEARNEERFEKQEARNEERSEKQEARNEARFEKLEAQLDKQDERNEERSEKQEARNEARFEKLEAQLDKQDERNEERSEKQEARNEARFEKLEAQLDKQDERNEERSEKQEARNEERSEKQEALSQQRHGEIQGELRDMNTRVSRLEAGGVHDRSVGRSGPQSPRRDDDSAAASDGESDPAPVAKRFDRSMVPLAGGHSEPQSSTGLARQAVPDERQVGETGAEPSEEESRDASR